MDKKKAFKILNLSDSACFSEAKKAYHKLAKTFHPDMHRTYINSTKKSSEDKMKEINLAFCYLAPLLQAEQDSKIKKKREEPQAKKSREVTSIKKENSFFSNMFKAFSQTFTSKKNSKTFKESINTGKPKKQPEKRVNVFDDILQNIHQNSNFHNVSHDKIKTVSRHKKHTYNAYKEYLILKRKMNVRQSRTDQTVSVERVEKITPVRPVNPL